MRKLDPSRPYGRVTPPHRGAHFDQDDLLFDVHGRWIDDNVPAPDAAEATTTPNGQPQTSPWLPDPQLPTEDAAANELVSVKADEPAPTEDNAAPAPRLNAHQELRKAIRELAGHSPRDRDALFGEVERLTGVRPEKQSDGLELLRAEGLIDR